MSQGAFQTVLTETLREAGTYYTEAQPVTVAANGITCQGLMDDIDAGNPANQLSWAWEYSYDGISFDPSRTAQPWTGGQLPKGGASGPPWLLPGGADGWSSSQQIPKAVRVRIENQQPLSFGWQIAN